MTELSRRQVLVGAAAVAAASALPAVAASVVEVAPAEAIPAWVVGHAGEFDWQHIIARTQREAMLFYADDYDEACNHEDYEEGCDCCEAIAGLEAERKPAWDGKQEGEITPGDWLRSGTGHICSRCSYETFPEEGGHGVGAEAVCSDCMTLADWDIIDPERAAELRAEDQERSHSRVGGASRQGERS